MRRPPRASVGRRSWRLSETTAVGCPECDLLGEVPPLEPTTAALANTILGDGGFILTVEIVGVLLLAAIVGAIVLVREK